jgi:hypothetical protein
MLGENAQNMRFHITVFRLSYLIRARMVCRFRLRFAMSVIGNTVKSGRTRRKLITSPTDGINLLGESVWDVQ